MWLLFIDIISVYIISFRWSYYFNECILIKNNIINNASQYAYICFFTFLTLHVWGKIVYESIKKFKLFFNKWNKKNIIKPRLYCNFGKAFSGISTTILRRPNQCQNVALLSTFWSQSQTQDSWLMNVDSKMYIIQQCNYLK